MKQYSLAYEDEYWLLPNHGPPKVRTAYYYYYSYYYYYFHYY